MQVSWNSYCKSWWKSYVFYEENRRESVEFFLAPSRTSNKTLPTTPNKQNGNVRPSQQSKNKKVAVSPLSNDSSISPTTMDEKNNNLITKTKISKTLSSEKGRTTSNDVDGINGNIKKEGPIGKNKQK